MLFFNRKGKGNQIADYYDFEYHGMDCTQKSPAVNCRAQTLLSYPKTNTQKLIPKTILKIISINPKIRDHDWMLLFFLPPFIFCNWSGVRIDFICSRCCLERFLTCSFFCVSVKALSSRMLFIFE